MPVNTEQVTVRIGGNTAALTAALKSAGAQVEAWARGLAANMGRRIRAYTERLIAVGLVLHVVRSLRDLARQLESAFESAEKLGVAAGELLQFRAVARELGITAARADDLAAAIKKADENAKSLAEAVQNLTRQFSGLSMEQIQAELLRRTGRYLEPEHIWALQRSAATVFRPAPEQLLGAFIADIQRFWRNAMTGALQWLFVSPGGTSLRAIGRVLDDLYGEDLRDRAARQQRVMELAREMERRARIERELADLAERMRKADLQLAVAKEDFKKAWTLLQEQRVTIENAMLRAVNAGDEVEIEKQRLDLKRLELEQLELRQTEEKRLAAQARQRAQLEEEFNRKLADAIRRAADLEERMERSRIYPDLEDVAAVRFRGWRPPQAMAAARARWLERAIPWLRARGMFSQAEAAETEYWTIRDRLARAGFIRPEEGLLKLRAELLKANSELGRLRIMAEREGIRIRPELDE